MNYITKRAISTAKYLIRRGIDPKDAIEITVDKYIQNPKLNIHKLIKEIKKSLKEDMIEFEEFDYDNL